MSGRHVSASRHPALGQGGIVVPVVRVELERAPGLGRARGRRIAGVDDAARVLAPFLEAVPSTHRLAVALLDSRDRLLAVARFDGGAWRACCLRPSEVFEAALVAGASSLYLAHRHPSRELWAGRADCASLDLLWRMGEALGLRVHDHLIFDERRRYASLAAARDSWMGWVRRPLTHRWPLAAVDQLAGGAPAGDPVASVVGDVRSARRAPFTLSGLRVRFISSAVRVELEHRPIVHMHADVAPVLAECLERWPRALVAGLVDTYRRLIGVALLRGRAADPHLSASALYRAAIACGAHAVYLAHRSATGRPGISDDDRRWAARAYTLGFELGRELRDSLVFGADGRYLSLRECHAGVDDWHAGDELTAPPRRMTLHQAQFNRRPERPSTTRAQSAVAALRYCVACQRRSNDHAACRYCGTPRTDAGIASERATAPRAAVVLV